MKRPPTGKAWAQQQSIRLWPYLSPATALSTDRCGLRCAGSNGTGPGVDWDGCRPCCVTETVILSTRLQRALQGWWWLLPLSWM